MFFFCYSSFPSIYLFPKFGDRDEAAERRSPKEKGHIFAPKASIASKFLTIPPLPIVLLHLRRLYTERVLRASKLCKHLLREPSDEALFTSRVTETVGRSLSEQVYDLVQTSCFCRAELK